MLFVYVSDSNAARLEFLQPDYLHPECLNLEGLCPKC